MTHFTENTTSSAKSIGMYSCAIVIPVYNEEDSIAETIHRLQEITSKIGNWKFDFLCVDDGSSDNTSKILESIEGITVITHHVNRGYGAALRTGLDTCTHDWIFITDADSTYPIEDLPQLTAKAEEGADMVVGARFGEGIQAKPFHRLARWLLRKMAHSLSGVMVPDLNSGMRMFRRQLYAEFRNILPMGFSFTTTITLAALYSNYRTIYVPIRYFKRIGKSNIKPISDFLSFTLLIVRIATYFEPLRFFLPSALTIMALGILKGSIDFIHLGAIGSLAVIMLLMGVQVFITGILAEVIVKRSSAIWRNPVPFPISNDSSEGRIVQLRQIETTNNLAVNEAV